MSMGELLISGSGKKLAEKTTGNWWSVLFITGMIAIIGFLFANMFGYQTVRLVGGAIQVKTQVYNIFMWSGIFMAVAYLGMVLLYGTIAAKTEIFVHENGIKGEGVGPKFIQYLGDTDLSSFQLGYDSISSVDITNKNYLSINAHGKIYVIAVDNANEITDVINGKLHQLKTTATNS